MAGAKRKAESSKDAHIYSTKKPKIDSVRNKPEVSKSKAVMKLKTQAPADSSDEGFDGFDDDNGGANLDAEQDSDESEVPVPIIKQGVHPDRVKANSNAAGPNGTL
jgi:hypothetical protein